MAGLIEDIVMRNELTRRHQNGAMGGLIIAVLLFGGFLTLGASLGPLYMDHNTMSTVMDKMAQEPGMGSKPDSGIMDSMRQRLKLNNIRDFDLKQHVVVDRSNARGPELILDYEVRVPLVHNLDLIATFYKKVELRD